MSINDQAHDEIPTVLKHVTVPGRPSYDLLTFKPGYPFLSKQLQSAGVYEPCETALMCQLLTPGDTVLDIGANIGYFTILASKFVGPNGRVFAFEPEAKNFHVLTQNVDRAGQDNPGGHHSHRPAVGLVPNTQNIQTTSIDLFLANHTGGVNVVKIDAQGWEPSIIKGMKKTLSKNLDKLIVLLEFTPRAQAAGPGGLDAAIRLLEDQFTNLLFIDETSMQVSDFNLKNISLLVDRGLDCLDGAYAKLLGFASPAAYQTARRRFC